MLPILTMPGYLIRRAHQQSTAVFTERMGALGHDITPIQFGALCVIQEFPGLGQTALADVVGYDRVTIGGVIDRLVAKGLVKRSIPESDRRARVMVLTQKGSQVLGEIMPAVVDLQSDIIKGLTEGERHQFVSLLGKVLGVDGSVVGSSDSE